MDKFIGLKIWLSTGEVGVIESSFGQSGKFRVRFVNGINPQLISQFKANEKKPKGKGKGKELNVVEEPEENEENTAQSEEEKVHLILKFKKFLFDHQKKIVQ